MIAPALSKKIQLIISVALFTTGALVARFVPGSSGTIVGVLISFVGLVLPFALDFYQIGSNVDRLERAIEEEIERSKESILGAIAAHTLDLDSKFRDEPEFTPYLETGKKLLARADGVAFVQHFLMLQRMGEWMDRYYHDLPAEYEEEVRIDILADVILAARRFVLAYTYADHEHLSRFWGKSTEAIKKYYAAHTRALSLRSRTGDTFQLQRIFVLPAEFPQKPDDLTKFCEILDKLRLQCHMADLFWIKESEARRHLTTKNVDFPLRSFFLAGDRDNGGGVVSEGAAIVKISDIDMDEKLLRVIRSSGWIVTPEGMRTHEAFKRIRKRKNTRRSATVSPENDAVTLPGYILFSHQKADLKEFRDQFFAMREIAKTVDSSTKDELIDGYSK